MKHINTFGTWSRINEAEEMGAMEAPEPGGPTAASAASAASASTATSLDSSFDVLSNLGKDDDIGIYQQMKDDAGLVGKAAMAVVPGVEGTFNSLVDSIARSLKTKASQIDALMKEKKWNEAAQIYSNVAADTLISEFSKKPAAIKWAVKKAVDRVKADAAEVEAEGEDPYTIEERITDIYGKIRRMFVGQILAVGAPKDTALQVSKIPSTPETFIKNWDVNQKDCWNKLAQKFGTTPLAVFRAHNMNNPIMHQSTAVIKKILPALLKVAQTAVAPPNTK